MTTIHFLIGNIEHLSKSHFSLYGQQSILELWRIWKAQDKEIKVTISLEKNLHIGRKIKASNNTPSVSAVSFFKIYHLLSSCSLLGIKLILLQFFFSRWEKYGWGGLSNLVIWGVSVRGGLQCSIVWHQSLRTRHSATLPLLKCFPFRISTSVWMVGQNLKDNSDNLPAILKVMSFSF